jgi:hypothetical protein
MVIQMRRPIIWRAEVFATRLRHGVLLAALALAGCATTGGVPLQAGAPESEVIARLGNPSHVLADPVSGGRIDEYMNGPFGQTTYLARIGPDGRLISYEQVLDTRHFSQIQVGVSTKADALRTIGSPSETMYLSLSKLEVWSYPYKENPVSDSIMQVHFDSAGIVRMMQNTPDLRRDPDQSSLFGMGFRGFRHH